MYCNVIVNVNVLFTYGVSLSGIANDIWHNTGQSTSRIDGLNCCIGMSCVCSSVDYVDKLDACRWWWFFSVYFCRYAPDPRQARGSHSSQGSVGEEITRQKTSYTESAPPDHDQRARGGGEVPPQSQSLPYTYGENEPSDVPPQGSSPVPRQPSKSRGNSKLFTFTNKQCSGFTNLIWLNH